jgi:hypothetical protein
MKTILTILILAILSVTVLHADGDDLHGWVEQLGSPEASELHEAETRLLNAGKDAIPALEQAMNHDDPLVRDRAAALLARILSGGGSEVEPKEPERLDRPASTFSFSFRVDGKGVTLESGPEGVRLKLTRTDEQGDTIVEVFEAPSMEEFLERFPELAEEYGLGRDMPRMPEMPDFEEFFGQDLDEMFRGPFGREGRDPFDDMFRRMPRGMDGMEKEIERLEREMERMMERLERDPMDLLRDLEQFRGMGDLDELMEELRRDEEADEEFFAEPGTFGARVNPMDPVLREQLELTGEHGLWLDKVAEDSNAARMGLAEHDILLAIDGRPIVGTESDVMKVLREQSAFGGVMKVEVLRKGRIKTLSVPAAIIR